MHLEFMTREVFDTLILVVIIVGMALAFVRLRADFTRELPPDERDFLTMDDEDTKPNLALQNQQQGDERRA